MSGGGEREDVTRDQVSSCSAATKAQAEMRVSWEASWSSQGE